MINAAYTVGGLVSIQSSSLYFSCSGNLNNKDILNRATESRYWFSTSVSATTSYGSRYGDTFIYPVDTHTRQQGFTVCRIDQRNPEKHNYFIVIK